MVQTSAGTTRFTMLQGMDSLCTVTWKQNLVRLGHLSCLGASKTSYSRTLGTFQMSKIKVKLCDNRCYCTPPSLPQPFVVIWSRSVTSNENWKKTAIGWGYSCGAFFKAKTSHISDFNNCIKKRKGKEKRKHACLFVYLTGSSKYCNFEQFCFHWQDNSLVNQRSCERKLP